MFAIGLARSSTAETRTWPRWRSRTRTLGSCGRCWRMTGSSTPATSAAQRRSEPSATDQQRRQGEQTTDCLGDHEVMARQVRPWLAKPAPDEAPRVRVSDRGVNQLIPSGTAAQSCNQSPNVRVQSLPSSRRELRAWHRGRPCTSGELALTAISLVNSAASDAAGALRYGWRDGSATWSARHGCRSEDCRS